MMKKILTYAVSALALASCSSDSLVSDSPANTQAPIAFNVGQKNITRADLPKLEDKGHYNFGVWAYKTKGTTSQLVMENYLVGYNGTNGYPKSGVDAGTWFYEGLGNEDYTGSTAKNKKQILRYWDYSTDKTDFFAYAPYNSALTFDEEHKTINVSLSASYDTESDFIYAGNSISKSLYNNKVPLQFKHIGTKVNVAFRESVPGYKVQLIDVTTDEGSGIQATPAVKTVTGEGTSAVTSYSTGSYNTTSSVTIDYSTPATPSATTSTTGATTSSANLKFGIPTAKSDGLVGYKKDENSTEIIVLPEAADVYAKSPTTYYAVVQPDGNPGFTFHVSYKLIAEDNGEEIIVRDARVFVPDDMVKWESNKAYTYNFTISTSSTGNTGGTVDVSKPDVPADKALNPIVFDNPTIVDYSEVSDAQDI